MSNRRLYQLDNDKCLLALFVNEENAVRTGFLNWLSEKDEKNLCNIIQDKYIVPVKWPNTETSEANSILPKLASCTFAKVPIQILCTGKWTEMRKEQKYYTKNGKLSTKNKEERKENCKKKFYEEYEIDAPARKKSAKIDIDRNCALLQKINDLPKRDIPKINYKEPLKTIRNIQIDDDLEVSKENVLQSKENVLQNLKMDNASLIKINNQLRDEIQIKDDKIQFLIEEIENLKEKIELQTESCDWKAGTEVKEKYTISGDENSKAEASNFLMDKDKVQELNEMRNKSSSSETKNIKKSELFEIKKEWINKCNKEAVQPFTKSLLQKAFSLKELGTCMAEGSQSNANIRRGIRTIKPPLSPGRKAAVEACVLREFSKTGSIAENKKNFNAAVRGLLAQVKANVTAGLIDIE